MTTRTNIAGHPIKDTDVERVTLRLDGKRITFLGRVLPSKLPGSVVVSRLNDDGDAVLSAKLEVIDGVETSIEREQIYIVSEVALVRRQQLQINLHYGEFEPLTKTEG